MSLVAVDRASALAVRVRTSAVENQAAAVAKGDIGNPAPKTGPAVGIIETAVRATTSRTPKGDPKAAAGMDGLVAEACMPCGLQADDTADANSIHIENPILAATRMGFRIFCVAF
jgi:hypothetical protein